MKLKPRKFHPESPVRVLSSVDLIDVLGAKTEFDYNTRDNVCALKHSIIMHAEKDKDRTINLIHSSQIMLLKDGKELDDNTDIKDLVNNTETKTKIYWILKPQSANRIKRTNQYCVEEIFWWYQKDCDK